MTATQLRNASRSIGAILMDIGAITPSSAEQILKLQRAANLRFGEAAIRLGLLSESDIQFALAQQFNYTYLPLSGAQPVSPELLAAYRPFSQEVEQLRALRSQLMVRWFDKDAGRKCLAIVGPDRHEGRSFLAANLAIVFSQLGERTLLIDADMRNPRQHELFKLDNAAGFSSLLGGRTANGDAIVPISAFANLAVLPAGPTPPNPLELLNRSTFDQLLDEARSRCDIILIDTPAASGRTDANMIAIRAGAALVLARRHQTRQAAFDHLSASLLAAGVAVVGSVLNTPPGPADRLSPSPAAL